VGVDELIASLRGHQQQQLAEIWQEAEARAAVLQKKADDDINDIRADFDNRLAAASTSEEEAIQRQLRDRKRQLLLQAEQRLAARLKKQAEQLLDRLRDGEYDRVFKKLVAELPERKWEKVRVNPADDDLAQTCLPQVSVEPDTTITGGLVVAADREAVQVDNTFEKRLEKIWPVLLPEMVGKIYREMRNNAPAQTSPAE
jgi:V/A-type H+-transporting ATPase subunit E